jgi:hypothetical protein
MIMEQERNHMDNLKPPKKSDWRVKLFRFFDKNGMYVAIGLCILIVAVTLMLPIGGNNPLPTPPGDDLNNEDDIINVNVAGSTALRVSVLLKDLKKPLEGDAGRLIFALDYLVYHETINVWAVHKGLDIPADLGTKVKAAMNGTVESIDPDPLMGNMIVLAHANGVKTIYASLDAIEDLEVGDEVKAGDVIGKVANTAIKEVAEGNHLHFEVYVDGKAVNPALYMR